MFCYQCEQTSQGQGCQVIGVCGKDENSATLQDLLIMHSRVSVNTPTALPALSCSVAATRRLTP
jgi:hydroxylamine reductase (hybrid-cluster protein)